ALASLMRLEVAQVRRRLVLPRWHQSAVRAQEIVLPSDADVTVALGADLLEPFRLIDWLANGFLGDRPGMRERVVDRRHFVRQRVGIVLVPKDPLLDDALIVRVQRDAGGVVGTGTLEMTRLDFERVEAAVAVGVDPFADRVTLEGRIDIALWPIAPVG